MLLIVLVALYTGVRFPGAEPLRGFESFSLISYPRSIKQIALFFQLSGVVFAQLRKADVFFPCCRFDMSASTTFLRGHDVV
jgi:hypothetical protein